MSTITIGTSTYNYEVENDNSGRFNLSQKGDTATECWYVAFQDAVTIGNHLLSTFASHPIFTTMKVDNIDGEPWGQSEAVSTWNLYRLKITYKTPEWGGGETEYKDEQYSIGGEIITIPGESVYYDGEETPSGKEDDVNLPMAMGNLTITLYNVSSINYPVIWSTLNKVNSSTWYGLEAGRALYLGADTSKKTTSAGSKKTVSHKFSISQYDHRSKFNPKTGLYEKLKTRVGDNYLYEEADFTVLGVGSSPSFPYAYTGGGEE